MLKMCFSYYSLYKQTVVLLTYLNSTFLLILLLIHVPQQTSWSLLQFSPCFCLFIQWQAHKTGADYWFGTCNTSATSFPAVSHSKSRAFSHHALARTKSSTEDRGRNPFQISSLSPWMWPCSICWSVSQLIQIVKRPLLVMSVISISLLSCGFYNIFMWGRGVDELR